MMADGECERRRTVGPHVPGPLFRLHRAGPVPFGDPPAGEVSHFLKELAAPPKDSAVEVAQDEGGEVRDVGPNRHIDDHTDALASEGSQVGRKCVVKTAPSFRSRS
jgi:hypothetical protein